MKNNEKKEKKKSRFLGKAPRAVPETILKLNYCVIT